MNTAEFELGGGDDDRMTPGWVLIHFPILCLPSLQRVELCGFVDTSKLHGVNYTSEFDSAASYRWKQMSKFI